MTRMTKLKVPTDAELAQRIDELVAAHRQTEDDVLRRQFESRARTELTEELNRDFFDAVLADQLREAGMTFVADVWPTHPAAGHHVGASVGAHQGRRPCGARRPFRLAEDGVWFCDYRVCSPLYPAGRLPQGPIVVAFLVDGVWRQAVPTPPEPNRVMGGAMSTGFEDLRGLGLQMNPEPLRGRPESQPEPGRADVFADGDYLNLGRQATAEVTTRSSADLLWRFVVATQNEAPWEVPAA